MNTIQSQILFNSFEIYDRKLPRFREGQIFHGTVIKLLPNDLALITVSRAPVVAKLEVALEAGQEYWFVVKKNSDTPMLQVLSSSKQPKSLVHPEQSVKQLLRQLGLPLTSTNISLVSYLKDEGIPFTKTFVQTSSSFLEKTSLDQGMKVLKYMIERKLPLNEQIFQSIYRFVSADKPLLAELEQIVGLLKTHSQSSPHVQKLTERLAQILNELSAESRNIEAASLGNEKMARSAHVAIAEQPPASMPGVLKQLLSILGLQHEKSVFQYARQQLPENRMIEQNQSLKPVLLSLLEENIPMETKQLVQDAVFRLTGQQVLMKLDETFIQFLLQIPIPKELADDDAVLRFESKNNNGQVDEDYCRIIFYLQLKKLRETVIDVNIQNRIINVTVYNEMHISQKQLSPFISLLKQQLELKNYTLSSVKWISETKANKQKKTISDTFLQPLAGYKGVDIKI